MKKISKFKILFQFVLFTIILYFIITSIIDYQFYKNKRKLENLISFYTEAKEVYFDTFHNIPFHSLSLKKVYAYYNRDNFIEIDDIKINYNFWYLIRYGIEKSITLVKINNISLKFNALELSSIIQNIIKNNINKNTNTSNNNIIKIENIQSKLLIKNLEIKLDILSILLSDIKASNITVELNNNFIKTSNLFSMNIFYSNNINIFKSDFELTLNLSNLLNPFGKGEINISDLNIGEIKLFENIKYIFELDTNFNLLVYKENNYNSPIIKNNKYNFYLSISKEFSINYERHKEYYIYDYIFDPGNYLLELLSKASNNLIESIILINSKKTKKNNLKFIISISEKYININGILNSQKIGNGLLNFSLNKNKNYIEGSLNINNVLFMRGLRGSGILFFKGNTNYITLNGNNIRINGGLIGSSFTTIKLDKDQIILNCPENRIENALLNGVINKFYYDVKIKFQNVPGEFIVSNIHIDALDISRGNFYGTCRICNKNSNIVNIFGHIYGYRIGNVYTGYSKQKYVIGQLFLSNTTLYISNISFPYHNLALSGIMDFILTNLDITDIKINGKVLVFEKYNLPIKGFIKVNELYSNMISKIIIDNKHTIESTGYFKSNFINININAKDFNLGKIGLYGNLNGNFYLSLTNLIINQIFMDIKYYLTNRNFRLFLKGQRDEIENIVRISNFMFDNDDDKLLGKGYLYQENKRLIGEINFIRGGNIKFSSSFEDINANISIRNFIFKNLYKKNTELFFNANVNIYGPLIFPNFNGNIKVVNTINSEPLFIDIPVLSRKWDEIILKSFKIKHKDLNTLLNIYLNINTNNIILKTDGFISLFNFLSFKNETYFIKNSNLSTITYNLEDIFITNNYAGNLSGHINILDNKYLFYKKEKSGINGFLEIENNNYLNWSIELDSLIINCVSSGELKDNNINAKLLLNTKMNIFYFLNIFKRIEGNLRTDLKIYGKIENPIIDGKIRINNLYLEVTNFNSRISNGNYNFNINNSKIIFNREKISTTTGDFLVNGYIDATSILLPYFSLKIMPYDSKLNFISMNINTGFMEIKSELIPQSLEIIGQLNSLKLSGKVIAQNGLLSINFLSLNNLRNNINTKQPTILDTMIWDLNIITGANIKFNSQFIEALAIKGNNITINGSFGNKTFSLKGEVGVNRGNITYLGREYLITEGIIRFSGIQYDFIPYVNLTTKSRDKLIWKSSEKVDVYLIFEGKADKIIIKDFYSIPYVNKEELSIFLGFQKKSESTNVITGLDTSDVIYTGMDTFVDLFFISPVAMIIRKNLGLDIFSLKTVGLSSFTKKYLETGLLDTDAIIEGTSIQIGKYLFPNLLLEGEIKLGRKLDSLEEFSFYNYNLLYSLGLEFNILNIDFWNINLNWKYQPIPEFKISPEYELKWELNIHKRF